MIEMGNLIKTADWKKEKHVPVIESPDKVEKDTFFDLNVNVGKEIPHPNTTGHHIRWISVYFLPDGEKFPFQIAEVKFSAHGESTEGPDSSTIYTNHSVTVGFKTGKPGAILACSYCNIHGLWQSSKELAVK